MTETITLHTYDREHNLITSENIDLTSIYVLLEESIIAGITHYKNIETDTIDTEVQCKTYFILNKSEDDDAIEFHFTALFPQKKSFLQKLFKSKSVQCLLLNKSECKTLIVDYFKLDRKAFELKHNEK